MANIHRLEDIEVDVDQLTFDEDERLEVAMEAMSNMNDRELEKVLYTVFEIGDTMRMAMKCANEISGALTEDEEREVLEELDFETPEPEPQTTEELIAGLVEIAVKGEGYPQAELRVIRKWVETAVRRTVADFKSLRSLYRKAGE